MVESGVAETARLLEKLGMPLAVRDVRVIRTGGEFGDGLLAGLRLRGEKVLRKLVGQRGYWRGIVFVDSALRVDRTRPDDEPALPAHIYCEVPKEPGRPVVNRRDRGGRGGSRGGGLCLW